MFRICLDLGKCTYCSDKADMIEIKDRFFSTKIRFYCEKCKFDKKRLEE